MAEIAEVRSATTSPDCFVTKKFVELQLKIVKESEIFARQQSFLEMLKREERETNETNVVVMRLPDGGEALEGACTNTEKLDRSWPMKKVSTACTARRLE